MASTIPTTCTAKKIGISFGRATGRFFSKYLSALLLLIGYIMAGFTERKQALHDKIAKTYVIYR